MKSSIYQNVIKINSLLLIIISFLVSAFSYVSLYEITKNNIEKKLKIDAENLAKIITEYYVVGDIIAIRNYTEALAKSEHWFGSIKELSGNPLWEKSTAILNKKTTISLSLNFGFGQDATVGIIELSKDISFELSENKKVLFLLVFAVFLTTFIAGFINLRLLKKLMKPLLEVRNDLQNQAKALGFSLESAENNEIEDVKRWFDEICRNWLIEKNKSLVHEKKITITLIAQQVAHDIRSPLSALTMMSDAFNSVPEEKRLIIRGAIQRINDIANDLLQKSKEQVVGTNAIDSNQNPNGAQNNSAQMQSEQNIRAGADTPPKTQTELIPAVVDLIISEKRIQYRDKMNVEITSDFSNSYGDFAEINSNELKRVLSNLINNSVEAFHQQKGRILISIQSDHDSVFVIVRDNGKGIPEHILAKLGEKGISHGKEGTSSGSGLGIYHAKKAIESFNGKFEVLSKVGLGTTITMIFPKASPPEWFTQKLTLQENMQVISLDDDLSIHQIWRGRLQSLNIDRFEINLLSFTSGAEFKSYVEKQRNALTTTTAIAPEQKIYLVDYELLNQNKTGVDLIEELGLGAQAILVTSRYEEEHIRVRCSKLKVKLIPKGLAGFVPIEIKRAKKKFDAILIDDDALIHMTWQIVAKEKNKTVKLLKTEAEFLALASEIDPVTSIYIDVNLAQNVNGVDVAKRIYDLGFLNLYLATGYSEIEKPSFIKAVVGKDPQI